MVMGMRLQIQNGSAAVVVRKPYSYNPQTRLGQLQLIGVMEVWLQMQLV